MCDTYLLFVYLPLTSRGTTNSGMQMTHRPVISATGLFTPDEIITNEELVESFNSFVDLNNQRNADAIASGVMEPLQHSSVEFIEKASGIKARHVMAKAPVLDPEIMAPRWEERPDEELRSLLKSGSRPARMRCSGRGAMRAMSTQYFALPPICSAPIRRWRWRFRMRWGSRASALT